MHQSVTLRRLAASASAAKYRCSRTVAGVRLNLCGLRLPRVVAGGGRAEAQPHPAAHRQHGERGRGGGLQFDEHHHPQHSFGQVDGVCGHE
jgi:hypothetical protein